MNQLKIFKTNQSLLFTEGANFIEEEINKWFKEINNKEYTQFEIIKIDNKVIYYENKYRVNFITYIYYKEY